MVGSDIVVPTALFISLCYSSLYVGTAEGDGMDEKEVKLVLSAARSASWSISRKLISCRTALISIGERPS